MKNTKKVFNYNMAPVKTREDINRRLEADKRLTYAASHTLEKLYESVNTTSKGLSDGQLKRSVAAYGENRVSKGHQDSIAKRIFDAFVNPFSAILFVLALVSTFTDIIWAAPEDKNAATVIIITTMILLSGLLRFIQETRSGNAAAKLSDMIKTTTCVERLNTGRQEIPLEEVAVGDLVHLSAGDMIPGDIRICTSRDLFISQSSLTGESEPVEKYNCVVRDDKASITDYPNLAFMASNVISGSASGIVIATGDDTLLGDMAKELNVKPPETSFEKGVNSVSWVLIRFMFVMVPIVFLVNGITKGNWMHALLFAISVAVGLTPAMLPMIVTTCLAKGAVAMSHKKVIIKNLNSIQNLGSIDILCTDKTGTLTQDQVILEYPLDIHGKEDLSVLKAAFLNSFYQTGLKNLMDLAIIRRTHEEQQCCPTLCRLETNYRKIDEIPFDFERRRMSVVVADGSGTSQLITKGALEEMLKISAFAEYKGNIMPLTPQLRDTILAQAGSLNEDGMRILGVAQKTFDSHMTTCTVADEDNMVLIGYLAFLDPPKETTAAAIQALKENGVSVKILTGDNEKVTRCVCRQVGLPIKGILLGSQVEELSDEELTAQINDITVFAKLSPAQKARVVRTLKDKGHSVGYMGDGINDAAAMKVSDVGISVDTAVDIAKESADVILLEKDLMVLEQGIIEGRKTYANMIKYIKMTVSSNFGNMFSVLAASAFLPFLPMESIHLILLSLIYDISCTAIPWDNVDKEFLAVPRKWEAFSVSKFMLWMGPTSSAFDIATYVLMYFIICPAMFGGKLYHQLPSDSSKELYAAIFQSGWFIESMWTQTLVIHMIRTPKVPFIQSHASAPVTLLTFAGIAALTTIPFTPVGNAIGLQPLPGIYFVWLMAIILGYMLLATIVKKCYIKKFGELL